MSWFSILSLWNCNNSRDLDSCGCIVESGPSPVLTLARWQTRGISPLWWPGISDNISLLSAIICIMILTSLTSQYGPVWQIRPGQIIVWVILVTGVTRHVTSASPLTQLRFERHPWVHTTQIWGASVCTQNVSKYVLITADFATSFCKPSSYSYQTEATPPCITTLTTHLFLNVLMRVSQFWGVLGKQEHRGCKYVVS